MNDTVTHSVFSDFFEQFPYSFIADKSFRGKERSDKVENTNEEEDQKDRRI